MSFFCFIDWICQHYSGIILVIIGFLLICRLICVKVFNTSSSPNLFNKACQSSHNRRRSKTYPPPVPNTWYHIIDSDEVQSTKQKPIYVRAIGQNFAIWRTKDGEPIVMDAYCPHLGANIAVGGVIKNDCIQCPFHEWTFDSNGCLVDIPYITNKEKMKKIPCKPIRKWIAKDFCGLLCVYFHADFDDECENNQPQFELPSFIANELDSVSKSWHLYSTSDIGHVELSCVDWLDQSGDHAHFHTLHSTFLIPYTKIALPQIINNYIGITHKLTTIIGNKWIERLHGKQDPYYGDCNCKYYLYFLDKAGIKWKNKTIESTESMTKEFYIGPAIMIFHIPLASMGIGDIKIFVTTTPTLNDDGESGGSIMRIRVWLSDHSWRLRFAAWFIVGIAISQLLSDIDIMCNKIRRRKPIITKGCGPYTRVNSWLKNFYSKNSANVGKSNLDDW